MDKKKIFVLLLLKQASKLYYTMENIKIDSISFQSSRLCIPYYSFSLIHEKFIPLRIYTFRSIYVYFYITEELTKCFHISWHRRKAKQMFSFTIPMCILKFPYKNYKFPFIDIKLFLSILIILLKSSNFRGKLCIQRILTC